MTRDNVLFTVCGFIIGLTLGTIVLGPYFFRHGWTSPSVIPAAAVPAAAPTATAPAGDPAVMQNVMQQVAQLKSELGRNPHNAAAAVQLANLYMDAQKYPQAIAYYQQALAEDDDPDVATDLGICYRATGDLNHAMETFMDIQEKHPDHWQSLFNQAIVLVDLKRLPEARAIVDRLKKMRSDDPDVQRFDQTLRQLEK